MKVPTWKLNFVLCDGSTEFALFEFRPHGDQLQTLKADDYERKPILRLQKRLCFSPKLWRNVGLCHVKFVFVKPTWPRLRARQTNGRLDNPLTQLGSFPLYSNSWCFVCDVLCTKPNINTIKSRDYLFVCAGSRASPHIWSYIVRVKIASSLTGRPPSHKPTESTCTKLYLHHRKSDAAWE